MATQTIIAPAIPAGGTTSTQRLAAPSQYVMDPTEFLTVSCTVRAAPVNITMLVRVLQPGGLIQVEKFTYQHAVAGIPQTAYFIPGAGAILGLTVYEDVGTSFGNVWGQNFCTVGVSRGQGAAATEVATLVQSYITKFFAANWPGLPSRSPLQGPGVVTYNDYGDGLLGSNFMLSINPGIRWRPFSVTFIFTTTAAVADRYVFITLKTGTHFNGTGVTPVKQPAGNSWRYTAFFGGVQVDQSVIGVVCLAMPPNYQAAFQQTITLDAVNLQPNDQFTAIVLSGEQWIDPS